MLCSSGDVEAYLLRMGFHPDDAHSAALSAGVYDALASSHGDLFVQETAKRIAGKFEAQR